jgi:enoyl-CoA hydratase/carnithine racemase
LHCDLVVASKAARFGMSLAQIGLAPSWFLAKKLLEVAGPVTTRRILLLGDPLPAQRLYELGVISHIAEPGELEAVAGAVIERLAANAPLSLKAMKALIVREMAFRDDIAHEDVDALVEGVRRSADAREGMAARLARRKPAFKGR